MRNKELIEQLKGFDENSEVFINEKNNDEYYLAIKKVMEEPYCTTKDGRSIVSLKAEYADLDSYQEQEIEEEEDDDN